MSWQLSPDLANTHTQPATDPCNVDIKVGLHAPYGGHYMFFVTQISNLTKNLEPVWCYLKQLIHKLKATLKPHTHNIRIVFYIKDNILEHQGNVGCLSSFMSLYGSSFEWNKLTGVFIYFSVWSKPFYHLLAQSRLSMLTHWELDSVFLSWRKPNSYGCLERRGWSLENSQELD